ncbi:MAG: hypothetical protein V3V99_11840 [candidate division Zixibacteria bacterium]
MMGFSFELLLFSLLWAGISLLIIDYIWYLLEKKLALLNKLPKDILEEISIGYFFSKYIMQLSFLVAVPSAIYSLFYLTLPFYGARAGIAVAFVLFVLGIVPFTISLIMRVKLPLSYVLFQLAGYLIKLVIVYGIIGYIYIL